MSKRITAKPWFGPKRIGWGWRPQSWQGWLVTVVFVALAVATPSVFTGGAMLLAILVLLLAFAVIAAYTGDPPG